MFNIGDEVFYSKGRGTSKESFMSRVIKINKKTISVQCLSAPWIVHRLDPNETEITVAVK